MNRLKKMSVLGVALLSLFLFASMASAHVTVQPKQTTQGGYEVFAVRVPSEKENVTTTAVKVKVPDGVKVSRVEPKAGWKYELERAADTKAITSITWTSEGSGLTQTEFTDFRISGKVADDATQLVWKAYQTYSDKSVVEWVGGEGADYPASVTTVTAGTGEGDSHGGGTSASSGGKDTSVSSGTQDAAGTADTAAGAAEVAAAPAANETSSSSSDPTAIWLSAAAAVLGALALIVALSRKKR
ncbi:YcnI family protein [Paenibacillus sp. R14(2021)]|uniref:YcnI family copper-binding membrane protein n=1 Tax=Paenibacillus sp. R14(2021) TaxID=2859228 RepID=UPI001C6165C3|nr:YcnI family protein [Paenibacillus sp. R14(2021)]